MGTSLPRALWRQALIGATRSMHYAILAWGLTGWLAPNTTALMAYVIAMPTIMAQWLLNRNTCVLNNVESWLATGRWRDPNDKAQGGFIAAVIQKVFGVTPTPAQANLISYGLLTVFWCLAWLHLMLRG